MDDEPAQAQQLQTLINQSGLTNHVFLAGFRADIPNLLRRFDIFCLPSIREGMSNALLEAMMAACPIVATDTGGTPDIITHEQNGLLTPPQNPSLFASKLITLLQSPHTARTLGENARQTVIERYDAKAVVKQLEQLYVTAI